MQPRCACSHRHRRHTPPTRVPLPIPPVDVSQRIRRLLLRRQIPGRARPSCRSPHNETTHDASPAGRAGSHRSRPKEACKHTKYSESLASWTSTAVAPPQHLDTLFVNTRGVQNGRHARCLRQPPLALSTSTNAGPSGGNNLTRFLS